MPQPTVRLLVLSIAFAVATSCATLPAAEPGEIAPFEGGQSTWHEGFARYDYLMDEQTLEITPFKRSENENFAIQGAPQGKRRCVVVAPQKAAPGAPWSWRGCYWDHEPQTEIELLRRGFHVAFITPDPGRQWDAWYTFLTEKHGLSRKPAFIGMSKGGVNSYEWSTNHPDKVSCIYADNPAIRPEPFSKLHELASHDVGLLNICGSADFLLQRHTLAIEQRYKQLNGSITVVIKDGHAHHPHSLPNPKLAADWIVDHMQPRQESRPPFADESFAKAYYYSDDSVRHHFRRGDIQAIGRGPGFVECYQRYDADAHSAWGLSAMSIIVPHEAAAGKPWIMRADEISRDSTVDQALLAAGYHIVITPITAQSGAVQKQWDDIYQMMVANGFSKRPVLIGSESAAGEAYAWAELNPAKVAAIYGHNPALRSLMVKTSPKENLAKLAEAKTPLLHVSDQDDPWFADHTQFVQQRYGELGGQITVIRTEAKLNTPMSSADSQKVVEWILAQQSEK